ncbi:MAG TPA: TVP38/TMEM64 family protein [Blastocatellia bacterium]|nr:TVP38/TMEM64 family protein [Blastocatellia bacterium]
MKNRKAIMIAVILLLVGIGFLFLPVKAWTLALQHWIQSLGWIGPLVFVLFYVIATILLIPGSALTLAAGAIFGLWVGAVTVIVGANLGALGSFLLAKTRLRDKVQEWAAANPKFAALDRAIGQNGFKMVTLTRLSPAFPFTLLNYLLGVTSVRTAPYVLGNLLGMLPASFLYVYLGSLAGETLSGAATGGATTLQLVLKIVGLLATVAVVIFVTRIARKAIAEAEGEAAPPSDLQASEVRS